MRSWRRCRPMVAPTIFSLFIAQQEPLPAFFAGRRRKESYQRNAKRKRGLFEKSPLSIPQKLFGNRCQTFAVCTQLTLKAPPQGGAGMLGAFPGVRQSLFQRFSRGSGGAFCKRRPRRVPLCASHARKARMELRIASTATPTSANTASGICKAPSHPNALHTSTIALIASASTMFCRTIPIVLRA